MIMFSSYQPRDQYVAKLLKTLKLEEKEKPEVKKSPTNETVKDKKMESTKEIKKEIVKEEKNKEEKKEDVEDTWEDLAEEVRFFSLFFFLYFFFFICFYLFNSVHTDLPLSQVHLDKIGKINFMLCLNSNCYKVICYVIRNYTINLI